MRISRLEVASSNARPALRLDPLGIGLTVITGRSGSERSAIADCVAHLLYGRRASLSHQPAGLVDIETRLGNFRLRREPNPTGTWRLTITSLSEEPATAETISRVLGGCSPQFLNGLFYFEGIQTPQIEWLLSEIVAANVTRLCSGRDTVSPNRSRQEELLGRRDDLSKQVEQHLAERRLKSESLARRVEALASRRAEWTEIIEQTRVQLHALDVELASISTHARYRELESIADRAVLAADSSEDSLQLDEVDDQITKWRTTLHELERRESQVRTELARLRPTDSAAALPLADQRASIAVVERLVADLQNEVARFARSVASNSCVCRDAHPRLQPLVTLLEQQVVRLASLTGEQEHAIRWHELRTEAQHLARSQAELREQLEHLQARREGLTRRARPRRWHSTREMEPARLLGNTVDASQRLEKERHNLVGKLDEAERRYRELDREWHQAVAERTVLLADRLLEQKQTELAELQRSLQSPRHEIVTPGGERKGLRGSDYLAQLTNGRLIELKLASGGRRAEVVDCHARTVSVESLTRSEQQLVAMSLSLAIIAGLRHSGFHFPLILDDPFAQLDDRQTAILAGVLRDFAGQQVFVFTDRLAALEQFRTWGATIHDLQDRGLQAIEPSIAPRLSPVTKLERRNDSRREPKPPTLRVQGSAPAKKRRKKTRPERQEDERPQLKRSRSTTPAAAKFYLELSSPIGAAPSVSNELAAQLQAIGVRQVRDLLGADASKLATQLADCNVSPVEIVAWQHQSRLCCRIPGLRPHEAAILVGAGFSTPEDVASMKPADLHGFILSFAQMEYGRELLGNDAPPDHERVESWIRSARHARVLGAA